MSQWIWLNFHRSSQSVTIHFNQSSVTLDRVDIVPVLRQQFLTDSDDDVVSSTLPTFANALNTGNRDY